MGRVLVIDDEPQLGQLMRVALSRDGHEVQVTQDPAAGIALALDDSLLQVVITDLRMPGMDGLEVLRHLRKAKPGLVLLVITAYADWNAAVAAMQAGAFNFIAKPFDNDALRRLVRRACEAADHAAVDPERTPINLIGNSPAMSRVQGLIEQVAAADTTVLVTGESGTGKELVAHALHYGSRRADGPFVRINSGALTTTLLESELFGHRAGAFTGATETRPGLFARANGGTLFLDEVGELAPETQVKLLRVLETGEYLPVGASDLQHCDVRVIAATHRNLKTMVSAGTFREDLYYRLAILTVQLPALRERREDIPLLAGHLLARNARRVSKTVRGFTASAASALSDYAWPGNIRELDNRIQRGLALCEDDQVDLDDLFGDLGPSGTAIYRAFGGNVKRGTQPHAALEVRLPRSETLLGRVNNAEAIDLEAETIQFERLLVEAALNKTGDNLTEAGKLLGLSFRQIRYKVRTLGLR